ncbi:MAG: hypothetical protein ACI9HK_006193 [Pirellulaceae bacterium]|jgi:hypothetical protein
MTDFLLHSQLRTMEKKFEHLRTRDLDAASGRAGLRDDIDYLEEVLAHNLLLTHATVNTLMNKGIFTREELLASMVALDETDGAKDGKLDLESTLPTDKRGQRRPRGILDKLRQLEKSELVSPVDFLQKLEDKRQG